MKYRQLYIQSVLVSEAKPWVEIEAEKPPDRIFYLVQPEKIAAHEDGISFPYGEMSDPFQERVVIQAASGLWYIVTPGPAEGRWRPLRSRNGDGAGEWFKLSLKPMSP